MEEFGLAALKDRVQIMNKAEFLKTEEYKQKNGKIYNLYFLVTLDTGYRFAQGIRSIHDQLRSIS